MKEDLIYLTTDPLGKEQLYYNIDTLKYSDSINDLITSREKDGLYFSTVLKLMIELLIKILKEFYQEKELFYQNQKDLYIKNRDLNLILIEKKIKILKIYYSKRLRKN